MTLYMYYIRTGSMSMVCENVVCWILVWHWIGHWLKDRKHCLHKNLDAFFYNSPYKTLFWKSPYTWKLIQVLGLGIGFWWLSSRSTFHWKLCWCSCLYDFLKKERFIWQKTCVCTMLNIASLVNPVSSICNKKTLLFWNGSTSCLVLRNCMSFEWAIVSMTNLERENFSLWP